MTAMPVPLPRMCSVLAHEIRTPLSVLQGYIRLLQRQREPGHPEHAMLEAMLSATGQITAIARHHLEFSATSFMSVTVFDLNGNRLAHFNNLKTFENIQDRVRNLLPQGAYILKIQNETFNKTQFLKIQ